MITPQLPSEQLLFSTVRIEVSSANGQQGVATGFFFHFPFRTDKSIPVIITNRHVVKGARRGMFQLHEMEEQDGTARPSGRFFTVTLDNFEAVWIPHPGDADLCAMPIQPLLTQAKIQKQKEVFYKSLSPELIPSDRALEELSAIEEVVMVGYPTGLWDEVNNMPIVRRGITAVHPAIDFQGRADGLIDAACFPGCSGSPVLILNEGMYRTKQAIHTGGRVLLIGVLHSGPVFTAEGDIVMRDIPMQTVPIAQMRLPMNLGIYVKAREILTLGETVKQFVAAREGKSNRDGSDTPPT